MTVEESKSVIRNKKSPTSSKKIRELNSKFRKVYNIMRIFPVKGHIATASAISSLIEVKDCASNKGKSNSNMQPRTEDRTPVNAQSHFQKSISIMDREERASRKASQKLQPSPRASFRRLSEEHSSHLADPGMTSSKKLRLPHIDSSKRHLKANSSLPFQGHSGYQHLVPEKLSNRQSYLESFPQASAANTASSMPSAKNQGRMTFGRDNPYIVKPEFKPVPRRHAKRRSVLFESLRP